MKSNITLLFFIITSVIYAQSTVATDTSINKLDAAKQKQGLWKEKLGNMSSQGIYLNNKKGRNLENVLS
ncbi:MAG: hypothetical protein IPO70_12595 [Bacteroidetes bacterium]|nr:hypothetical protein [Bacteroidota bacterium]